VLWRLSVAIVNTIDEGIRQARKTLSTKGDLVMEKVASRKGKRLIFRAWRTINGKQVHASEYGLKAWPIWV